MRSLVNFSLVNLICATVCFGCALVDIYVGITTTCLSFFAAAFCVAGCFLNVWLYMRR